MKRVLILALLLLSLSAVSATAWDINLPPGFSQSSFKSLSKDLGTAVAYRNLASAEPLGTTGFDIAAQTSVIDIQRKDYWWLATGSDAPTYVAEPTLRVRKGLPLGIDVGVMYSKIQNTDFNLYGVELSKAILDGGTASPSLGIRCSYTKLDGAHDLKLQTAAVDANISKGILFLTPYAGVGAIYIDSQYKGTTLALSKESFWQSRGFLGLKISPLPIFSVTAEAEYAVRPIYSIKAAVNF